MIDVFLDALIDSLKVFGIVLILYIVFSFIEGFLAHKMSKRSKLSPLIGSSVGLIPQCGFSVLASDLYVKNHITMGTICAVFIACSDEALPMFLSEPDKIFMTIPLLLTKFIVGFIVGYLVDFIFTRKDDSIEQIDENEENEAIDVLGCKHEEHKSKKYKHVIHPLIHSIKIFAYVFVVNLAFGFIIYGIGEDTLSSFLRTNRYLAPLFSVVIGLIPNCASSVIISEMYLMGGISFGSCVGGLCCNAGLGFVILLKNPKIIKKTLKILLIVVVTGLIVGYGASLITGF